MDPMHFWSVSDLKAELERARFAYRGYAGFYIARIKRALASAERREAIPHHSAKFLSTYPDSFAA